MSFPWVVLLAVFLVLSPALRGQGSVAENHTVVPGKQVGGIGKYTSAGVLMAIYGVRQVEHKKLPKPDGELYDASIICAGSDWELEVVWEPAAVHERVLSVELVGKGWALGNGLKLGLTVAEVQRIHGQVFQLVGFGGDYGGYAEMKSGALGGGLSLRFAPLERRYSDALRGPGLVQSDHADMPAAQAVLCEISVVFP